MKVSVFTVMLPELSPEEAVEELRQAGYDGVEWRVTAAPPARRSEPASYWANNFCTLAPTPDDAQRARRLADSAGLNMPSLGTYNRMPDLAAVERDMQFAQSAGVSQIRVGVGRSLDSHTYAELFAQTQKHLEQVVELGRRYGVRALVETHPNTITPSASSAYRLLEPFDPAAVGVIYDPGNLVTEGYEDYRIGLELLGPYLAHVHIKNGAFKRPEGGGLWRPVNTPLEDGAVDFAFLFATLRKVGYRGWLGVEDFSGARPVREALRHNLQFIRSALQAAEEA
jgi:sugar phosphate isomerase/epimerase